MKTTTFLIAIFASTLIFTSCKDNDMYYADENIVVNNEQPGFSVYKTKEDYFNYIYVGIDSIGNLTMTPAYSSNSYPQIIVDKNGKVTYTQRWKLKSGYIVCKEMGYKDIAFTNVTFQEMVEHTDLNGGKSDGGSWLLSRIIDKDPFTNYYWSGTPNYPYQEFTLGQINDMIEKGTIETVFKKLK